MSQRTEFCLLASKPGINMSDLCRRFKISRRTGYKWINRYSAEGINGLFDHSRRPQHHPCQTPAEIEHYVIELRKKVPEWGSKKIYKLICNAKESGDYEYENIPCKKTITKILGRNGLIDPNRSKLSKDFERFVRQYPNELWQMDYKGWFRLLNRQECHPLTITDDHSRYNLCLQACKNEQSYTVKDVLINVFDKYGLPYIMLTDNGNPWGTSGAEIEGFRSYSSLEKWLIQLNIRLIHGRPYHPQTQGKEERFHKTLKQELLDHEQFRDHDHCQTRFDVWREKYNCIRPHEALDFKTPADLYTPSIRPYPGKLKPYEYGTSDVKRKVQDKGVISFKNKEIKVGKAFIGEYVALRESIENNTYEIYFCNELIRNITL